MTTVHAHQHTDDPAWWERVAPILGLAATGEPNRYAGSGLLTVHEPSSDTRPGTTRLELLVPDPAATLTAAEAIATVIDGTIHATDGTTITVSAAVEHSRTPTLASGATQVAVMPIWYGPDDQQPVAILTGLGLAPRLAADAGSWRDFTADGGGQVAWQGAPSVALELSLEHSGDLDTLASRLTDEGVGASVVDEAYNRTLLVDTPDGGRLWVNGTQQDLYGYHHPG